MRIATGAKREAVDRARPLDQTRRGQTRCAYQATHTQSVSSPLKTGARLCSTACSGSSWSEGKRSNSRSVPRRGRAALPSKNARHHQRRDAWCPHAQCRSDADRNAAPGHAQQRVANRSSSDRPAPPCHRSPRAPAQSERPTTGGS